MKFLLLKLFVFLTILYKTPCLCNKISSEEFSLKFIENSLNSTKNTDNFVIAPYEAYNLYKQLFNIENNDEPANVKDDDNDDDDDDNDEKDSPELNTLIPTIKKQQKFLPSSSSTNLQDLLATISLTARWSFNFQTRDTHKRVFHQHGLTNQKMWVDFLRKDDIFHYSHNDQLNASILELPLNVKKIKLKLILPDEWNGLADLKEYFLENMQDFSELIKKSHRMTLVRVLLPKFHLSYKTHLKDFFEELSSQDVEKYGNISLLSNLEFNERGIGRFERTTVLFWNAYSYLRVSPELFDISHPFLFLITNKDGIQFFGQVVKMHN